MLMALASTFGAYLLLVLILKAVRPARLIGAQVRDTFTAPFSSHFGKANHDTRFRQLDDEVRRARGMDEASDSRPRAYAVQADVAPPHNTISLLNFHNHLTNC